MAASPLRSVALACAAALALASCGGTDRTADSDRAWPRGELRSGGKRVEAPLRAGEVHRYRLPLERGTLLRLVVDQQGIDATVALEDPAGAKVLEADRLINDRGPELVLAVAQKTGVHTLIVSGLEGGPGRYAARVEVLRPATEGDRSSAEAYRIFTGAVSLEKKEPEKAMAARQRALATWQELGEVALKAEALDRIARAHYDRGEYRQAAALYGEAADAFARAGDPRWEASARTNAGASLLFLAETREAAEQYDRALFLARREEDLLIQAKALHGLGQIAQEEGDLQQAFDRYREALSLWPKNDRKRPLTLHNLGVLSHDLGDERGGRDLLLEALGAWQSKDPAWRATTLSQLGRLAQESGRLDEARQYFKDALSLEPGGCGSAVKLARLALVEQALKARPAADQRLAEAFRVVSSRSCSRSAPTVHQYAAAIAEQRGGDAAARTEYRRSQALFAAQGDRMGEAQALTGLARSERALGDRRAALQSSRQALDILEGVRPTVLREDLRMSFFATVQGLFDFHIDLLMDMGKDEEAWATAERARARTLGDLLAEKGASSPKGAATAPAAHERDLQRQLNLLESQRLRTNEEDTRKLQSLRRSIATRVTDLESARGELRRRNPRRASLLRPEPVSLAVVRHDLLDGDTVLLEYRLGEPASTLWAISRDAFVTARLPPRHELERRAREAASQISSTEWPRRYRPALCELSRMLLERAAPVLAHRRLVVIADGALAGLPFSALPDPVDPAACAGAPALVDTHEIAYLPSVAVLLTQRRLLAGRPPAPRWLAEVADPVYELGDSRLGGPANAGAESRGGPVPSLHRLPGSGQEAADIARLLPADKVFLASGFDASRQTVTGGRLAGFRIVHFATHGVFDAEQPMLSALVLSQLDAAGRPVAGFLLAHEIYDLDLPAELVTLSACQTARGREVPGEGLVSGLPRAFLYAGAARVLMSLWKVDDRSTRDLMILFYRGLLERNLAPAQALQEAQRDLRRSGHPPRQWAGFVLLGDWRPLPPFSR
ncbi:MAG: CHAT domain-containing tetratricopeptide repeat protein [Thermoanaerobaculia bacterium]